MTSHDNAEELFPRDFLDAAVPAGRVAKRTPEPWHKPRKHWIRKEQWGRLVGRLLGELVFDGRPFRYLTLPGRYLLDVRHLHDICAQRQVQLRFLGFDSTRKNDPELDISMDEVWRLPWIHKDSVLLADRLEMLSNRKSLGYEHAARFNGFDAANLDLCDSVASREAGASDTALEAIKTLVELQAESRKEPWLLFVTTRADRSAVKRSVMIKLFEVLRDNLERNEAFRNKASQSTLFEPAAIEAEVRTEITLLDDQFVRAFGIGFAKWLLKLSLQAWKLKLEINACYRVVDSSQAPDMLSLAFRFESLPVQITDPLGLVPQRKTAAIRLAPQEDDLAVRFLDRFTKLVDVDQLLFSNVGLREQMIAENADLMSLARFDRSFLVEWGRANCWQPS
ncbi:MAG: hypothetical protein NTY19_10525 [Planctomycetota bacterium]|nr:hypothetical protein [Planctomycetota bacterium]